MAFPVALVTGLVELATMLFKKKGKVNNALQFLLDAGLNLEAFKRARKKIDDSVDKNAAETDPT